MSTSEILCFVFWCWQYLAFIWTCPLGHFAHNSPLLIFTIQFACSHINPIQLRHFTQFNNNFLSHPLAFLGSIPFMELKGDEWWGHSISVSLEWLPLRSSHYIVCPRVYWCVLSLSSTYVLFIFVNTTTIHLGLSTSLHFPAPLKRSKFSCQCQPINWSYERHETTAHLTLKCYSQIFSPSVHLRMATSGEISGTNL